MADKQQESTLKSQRQQFLDDPDNAEFIERRRDDLLRAATPQGHDVLTAKALDEARSKRKS